MFINGKYVNIYIYVYATLLSSMVFYSYTDIKFSLGGLCKIIAYDYTVFQNYIGRYQNTSFEHLGPAAREDTLANAKGKDESRTIHIFSVRNSEGSKNATIEQNIGCFA